VLADQDATAWTDGSRVVFVWSADGGQVELLLTRPALALPEGMRVDGAVAAVWRVRPTTDGVFDATIAWNGDTAPTNGGPESGENLDAQSWTDGRTCVMLGLPDYRLGTSYRPDGFRVSRRLERGINAESHVVCAWVAEPRRDDSVWFAVDCTPRQALGDFARGSRS
jgi:hypothetical protein